MTKEIIFLPELSFTIAKLKPGVKTPEEVFRHVKDFRESDFFPKTKLHLVDIRDCKFDFGIEKVDPYLKILDSYKDKCHIKKGVFLVNTPKETAITHLIIENNPEYIYCAGRKLAYEYLNPNITYDEFLRVLEEVSKQ